MTPLQRTAQQSIKTIKTPICRLGLGLAALGRPGYINLGHAEDLNQQYEVSDMSQQAAQVLDEAWQLGIRYFDVARSYGKAEEFLSEWLRTRAIAADSVLIGSKWGYAYTANWQVTAEAHEVKQHSLARLQQQWQESQALLGDQLDLYQIHSATLESGVLQNEEILTELFRLKGQGVWIGLSVSGPQQGTVIEQALTIERDQQLLFDSVQATWNLLERSAGSALKAAKQAGLFVIIKEAVANGRLTARNQNAEFAAARRLLEQEAQRLQTTLDALAIAGVLANDWVDIVLSGAARCEQLRENAQALHVPFDMQAAESLQEIVESPAVYWHTRSHLAWN